MVPFRASYDHLFVRFVTNAIQSVMCRYCSVSPHSRYSIQFQPSNRTFVQASWTERCICTTWLVKTEPLVPSPLSYLIQSAAILGDFYYTFFVMSSCVFLVQMAGISIKRLPHRGNAEFLRFRFFFRRSVSTPDQIAHLWPCFNHKGLVFFSYVLHQKSLSFPHALSLNHGRRTQCWNKIKQLFHFSVALLSLRSFGICS